MLLGVNESLLPPGGSNVWVYRFKNEWSIFELEYENACDLDVRKES
jgi:hypothetical protein